MQEIRRLRHCTGCPHSVSGSSALLKAVARIPTVARTTLTCFRSHTRHLLSPSHANFLPSYVSKPQCDATELSEIMPLQWEERIASFCSHSLLGFPSTLFAIKITPIRLTSSSSPYTTIRRDSTTLNSWPPEVGLLRTPSKSPLPHCTIWEGEGILCNGYEEQLS